MTTAEQAAHPLAQRFDNIAAKIEAEITRLERSGEGQNPTRKRNEQRAYSLRQAARLITTRSALTALAVAMRSDTVPDELARITTRRQIEMLIQRCVDGTGADERYVHVTMPARGAYLDNVINLVDTFGTKVTKDQVNTLRVLILRMKHEKGAGTYHALKGAREVEAMTAIIKAAGDTYPAKTLKASHADVTALEKAGIGTDIVFQRARKALVAIMSPENPTVVRARKIDGLMRDLLTASIPGYFPTPATVVQQMIDRADLRIGMTCLEPSAGSGAIADAMRDSGMTVTVIERSSTLVDILGMKGYTVAGRDILQHAGEYDRVLMNPPFENGQDMDHIQHCYGLLKPGGRLVAIIGAGAFSNMSKRAVAFRAWFDACGWSRTALPSGTFRASGTDVASWLICAVKP